MIAFVISILLICIFEFVIMFYFIVACDSSWELVFAKRKKYKGKDYKITICNDKNKTLSPDLILMVWEMTRCYYNEVFLTKIKPNLNITVRIHNIKSKGDNIIGRHVGGFISLDKRLLCNVESLKATLSHELVHYIQHRLGLADIRRKHEMEAYFVSGQLHDPLEYALWRETQKEGKE